MDKPIFIFVESNTSGTGRLFIETAKLLDFEPVLLCKNADIYDFPEYVKKHSYVVDTSDLSQLISLCKTLEQSRDIAGVFSSSEYYISIAAQLAQRLGKYSGNAKHIQNTRSKLFQRTQLEQHGLNPKYAIARSVEEAVRHAQTIGFPVVVKPIHGSGSVGVRMCNCPLDVIEHSKHLLSKIDEDNTILVEEMVSGQEYSVEMFNGEVIGITKKYVGDPPFFVEIGHEFPADISTDNYQRIVNAAHTAVRELGLTWGPIHVELRLASLRPVIMEVNPRLAGDMIPVLIQQAYGIDLIEATIQLAAGRSVRITKTHDRVAAIRFFMPKSSGIFHGMNNWSFDKWKDTIVRFEITKKPGSKIDLHGDFTDRVGYVICVAETSKDIHRVIEEICSSVQINMQ
ncbi:ATP-grasp domain-containing protein [Alicyclobacillus sendaiensis]|uniref:ATP-grasp domain-containing protein n=1 Tax=Alicyclobacillus sendaiensis TaxID=192387 RepID=UPI0026F47BCC|nr:ATP-grasp domain-containing protein [Alicyclobacillus sendaiensis]